MLVSSFGTTHVAQAFSEVFPHLVTATNAPKLVKIEDVDYSQVDAIFCCLPHATTQEVIKKLPTHLKIVDLSADFRLKNPATYAEWQVPDHLFTSSNFVQNRQSMQYSCILPYQVLPTAVIGCNTM